MNYGKLLGKISQASLLVLTTVLLLQGCKSSAPASGTSVGSVDGETGASLPGTPNATPTPPAEPDPIPSPTPLPPTSCLDSNGISHVEGETWAIAAVGAAAYVCPNPEDGEIPMNEEASLKCHDGEIVRVVHKMIPNPEFASCPQPMLAATVVAPTSGSSSGQAATSSIRYESSNLSGLSYACSNLVSGAQSQTGSISTNGSFTPSAAEDLKCLIKGTAVSGRVIEVNVTNVTDCGNKIKVNGRCEDFACTSLVAIAPNSSGVLDVPVRSSNGKCYAYKLMDEIANSTSTLTPTIQNAVVSRNHDVGFTNPNETRNPYLMGRADLLVNIKGPRVLKLAGSGDSLAPILVDNFLLIGIGLNANGALGSNNYHAYGTSDSTVGTTNGVLLNQDVIPLTAFASGGTSTIAPLNITDRITPNILTRVDVQALDAGGSRQLSNIYIVFQ